MRDILIGSLAGKGTTKKLLGVAWVANADSKCLEPCEVHRESIRREASARSNSGQEMPFLTPSGHTISRNSCLVWCSLPPRPYSSSLRLRTFLPTHMLIRRPRHQPRHPGIPSSRAINMLHQRLTTHHHPQPQNIATNKQPSRDRQTRGRCETKSYKSVPE